MTVLTKARTTLATTRATALPMALALVVAAAGAATQAAPRWETLTLNAQGVYYIDPASVTREGDKRTFNSMLDYRTTQVNEAGKPYLSIQSQLQVNCRMKLARIIHLTYYSGPMLSGRMIERQGMLQDWSEIDPTTPVQRMFRYVC